VWRWYYQVVGKGEAAIVDTWWQTENGGFLGSTLPALQAMKPGSCGPGVLGIYPAIYDEQGNVIPAGSGRAGNICIRNPWPGIFQTIWGQPERYVQIYYEKYCKDKGSTDWRDWPYFAGDGAVQAADGYFRILEHVWIVPDMPKTRSGKIMRRVIAGISNFTGTGDITTLANPEVVETIRHHVQAEKVERGELPRELSEQELQEIKAFGHAE
jgi:acyl-coenzyme A synthetase/AMP-(fatty) acid ligase